MIAAAWSAQPCPQHAIARSDGPAQQRPAGQPAAEQRARKQPPGEQPAAEQPAAEQRSAEAFADPCPDWARAAAVDGPLGLAVSGGSDSTALAVLAREAAAPGGALHGRQLVILTVDHGLRADAALDVAAVQALGRRLSLPVHALKVEGAPHGSLQAWAREARHEALRTAAARLGLRAVLTGHTLNDQAETLLLRLARGSGLKGLGAMRGQSCRNGLLTVRPLLSVPREALRTALCARDVPWREDPTNASPRFERTAMRALLPRLSAVGLTPQRLAATAAHLARASDAVDAMADALLAHARVDRSGAATLALARYGAAHEEVRLRALARLVVFAGAKAYPPAFAPLLAADRAILAGDPTTLGRARIVPQGSAVTLWREARAVAPLHIPSGGHGIFDGRYRVEIAHDASPLTIAPLGAERARRAPAVAHRDAMATAPAVFCGNLCVAAPTLGLWQRQFCRNWVKLSPIKLAP